MKFQFDSLDAFMTMNGHGPFVWAAYSITFVVIIFLVIQPIWQKNKFLKAHKEWQSLQNKSDSQ